MENDENDTTAVECLSDTHHASLDDLKIQLHSAASVATGMMPAKGQLSFESGTSDADESKLNVCNEFVRLNASGRGLTSFTPLYRMIAEAPGCHISEIDVSNNDLREIVNDEVKIEPMQTVSSLNLLENLNFESVQRTVTEVKQLFPNLRSLQISLSEEEDVSFIITSMPELEFLNGIKVNRAELAETIEPEQTDTETVDRTLQEVSVNKGDLSSATRKSRAARRKSVGSNASTCGPTKRRKSAASMQVDVRQSVELSIREAVATPSVHGQSIGKSPVPEVESPVVSNAPTVAARVEETIGQPQLSAIKEEDPNEVPGSEGRPSMLGIGAGLRAAAQLTENRPQQASIVKNTEKKEACAYSDEKHLVTNKENEAQMLPKNDLGFFRTTAEATEPTEEPELRPQDLEDLAAIFDRIRILYKRRGDGSNSQRATKLISKNKGGEDLAGKFDQLLSSVMAKLSKVFNEPLISASHKHIEIDRAKYTLYEFCQSVCNKFLTHWRQGITAIDAAELQAIQCTIARSMQESFQRVAQFSQRPHLEELRKVASTELTRMSRKCLEYNTLKTDFAELLADRKDREQDLIRQQTMIAELTRENEQLRAEVARNRDDMTEISEMREELKSLRQLSTKYENLRRETVDMRAEMREQTQRGSEMDLENLALGKQIRAKQNEAQRQTRLVSHLKEELEQLRDETEYLVQENQSYLERIIRQSKDPRLALTAKAEQEIADILRRALDAKKSRLTTGLQLPEDTDRTKRQSRANSSRQSTKEKVAKVTPVGMKFKRTKCTPVPESTRAERMRTPKNADLDSQLTRSNNSKRSKARSATRSMSGSITPPPSSYLPQVKTGGYAQRHSLKRINAYVTPRESQKPVEISQKPITPGQTARSEHSKAVSSPKLKRTKTPQPERSTMKKRPSDPNFIEPHKPPRPPTTSQPRSLNTSNQGKSSRTAGKKSQRSLRSNSKNKKEKVSVSEEHGMPTDMNIAFSFNENPRRPLSPPQKRDSGLLGALDQRSRSVTQHGQTTRIRRITSYNLDGQVESCQDHPNASQQYSSMQISHIIKQKLAVPIEPTELLTKRSQAVGGKRQSSSIMILKQLREVIEDIFAQKKKHDQRCVKVNRQSRETMQQFLPTYLTQKYGLRSLVIEQATAIIAACQVYQDECCEVMAFGKVLRNQVDEEFLDQQISLRALLSTHMRQALRERHATKSQADISRLLTAIESGKTMVDNWLWSQTLNLMFDTTDAFILQDRLRNVAQYRQLERAQVETKSFQFATDTRANERRRSREMAPRSAPAQKGQKKRGRPTSVQQTQTHQTMRFSYQDLLATMLSFQLQEREAYLKHFLYLFQIVDADGDGVVNNGEFIELYRRMRQQSIEESQAYMVATDWKADCDRLLDMVDPFGQERITFSDVVQLFSNTKRESLTAARQLTTNSKESLCGAFGQTIVQTMESGDSQFKSSRCAVPSESTGHAVNTPGQLSLPQSGIMPKQSPLIEMRGETFAANTGVASKNSLANISEESGDQKRRSLSPSKPKVESKKKRQQKSKIKEKDLLAALQRESDLAQQDMMKKLGLDDHNAPGSGLLTEQMIMSPGSSNQKQRTAGYRTSPLNTKKLVKGKTKSGRMTEAGVSEGRSSTNSRTGLPTMSAQEARLAAEINQIDEKLKRRI